MASFISIDGVVLIDTDYSIFFACVSVIPVSLIGSHAFVFSMICMLPIAWRDDHPAPRGWYLMDELARMAWAIRRCNTN